jgi:hypothetical protein
MSNLKEKFGKFELGKAQVKSVKGGAENPTVKCYTEINGRRRLIGEHSTNSPHYSDAAMIGLYGNVDGFIGCF